MSDKHKHKLISVIIPVFNEENNVKRSYDAVCEVFEKLKNYNLEIIFTDNHSTDDTYVRLEELAGKDSRVRVIRFARNYGFNKSLLTGYRLANGDAAVQLDCDLQDPPTLIPQFIKQWEQGYDIVVGVRIHRKEAKWLQNSRKIFYRLLNKISEDDLIEDAGDFRLIDRKVITGLKNLHDANPYVRGLVTVFAKNQVGIPYSREARQFDESKFPLKRLISLAVDGVISHSTLPLRLASFTGFIISGLTALLAIFYFVSKIFFDMEWPPGFATQVILILFGISLNAIFLGIIGEYVSRIYQNILSRPLTVIEKEINAISTDDAPKK